VTFVRPEYLWLLAALPLAGFFFAVGARRRRRLLAACPQGIRPAGRRFKTACFLSGLALVALAAAGPGFGPEPAAGPPPAPLRLIILLDCSRSMLARDLPPDRLTAAKALLLDVLSRLPEVEAGLVGFAGRAWLACPVTADRAALALYLDAIGPRDAPLGGTNPQTALEAARLALAGYTDGAALLVTDGEATTPATDAVWPRDIPLFTVAVGGATPAPVPDGTGGFVRDGSGKPVLAGVDAQGLADLATSHGGAAFRLAPDGQHPAPAIASALAGRVPAGQTASTRPRPKDCTELFLAAGLLLLLTDLLLAPAGRATVLALILVWASGPSAQAATSAADNVGAGLAAWEAGDFPTALDRFLAARVRDPDAPAILFDIGAAQYRLGRFEAARQAFDRAARAANGRLRARALYNQGNASFRLGDATAAIRLYEAALALDPADDDARANLAWLRSRQQPQPPAQEKSDDAGQSHRPGQSQTGSEEGSADRPGQAPSPRGEDDGSGGQRQGDASAEAAPTQTRNNDAAQATTPVAATEGQKAGERQAGMAGRADDPILDRIADLPGLPVPPIYGRPTVEKDW
jgi:Ca-activated chloride channel family protein